MLFPNEVCFETSSQFDGVTISVKECAKYISKISFEDAWLKANDLAKQKAESKLQEALEKIKKDKDLDIVQIKGCPGPRGFPGPKGPPGPPGPDTLLTPNIIIVNLPFLPQSSIKENGDIERVVIDVHIKSTFYINVIRLTGNIESSSFNLNIIFDREYNPPPLPGHLLYINFPKLINPDTYTLEVSGDVWFNSLANNQGPGVTQNNILFVGNNKLNWLGMFSFVSNGLLYVGNSNTTDPNSTLYTTLRSSNIYGKFIDGDSISAYTFKSGVKFTPPIDNLE